MWAARERERRQQWLSGPSAEQAAVALIREREHPEPERVRAYDTWESDFDAARLLQRLLRTVGLGFFDRVLGMAFGFARGCLIAIAVLMVATTIAPQSDAVINSELTPYLFAVCHDVSFLVPDYLQELMASGAFNLDHNSPVWINRH